MSENTTFCCYVKVANARDMSDEEFGNAVRDYVVVARRDAMALERGEPWPLPVQVDAVTWANIKSRQVPPLTEAGSSGDEPPASEPPSEKGDDEPLGAVRVPAAPPALEGNRFGGGPTWRNLNRRRSRGTTGVASESGGGL